MGWVDMAKLTKAGYARAKSQLGLKGKLTRTQAKRVFKKAIKSLGRKSTSRSSSKSKSTPKRKSSRSSGGKGGKRMGNRGKNITRTAFKWIRIGALAAPAVRRVIQGAGDPAGIMNNIISDYTGYNMTEGIWRWEYLVNGWAPYAASVFTTVGIPKLVSILRRL